MTLKILSFNLCCGDDPGGNSVAERAPRVAAVLNRCDPDVIGLQEYTPAWAPLLARSLGDRYEIYNRYRAENSLESTPILWKKDRFRCIFQGTFWLSDTPERESKGWDAGFDCYRICQYVCLEERRSGVQFLHMNTHFGFGDVGQIASARLLSDRGRALFPGPTVVTGDFNMGCRTAGYREMCRFFTDVNGATGKNEEATFHNYGVRDALLEKLFPAIHVIGDAALHLDHCFVRGGIRPLRQEIRRDRPGDGYPSDHDALLSDVALPGPAATENKEERQ